MMHPAVYRRQPPRAAARQQRPGNPDRYIPSVYSGRRRDRVLLIALNRRQARDATNADCPKGSWPQSWFG
jgi:hypothetical protein